MLNFFRIPIFQQKLIDFFSSNIFLNYEFET